MPADENLPQQLNNAEIYKLLSEHPTDMMALHTVEGEFLWVSSNCIDITGLEPHELVGRDAYEFFHPDDLPRVTESHKTIQRDGVIFTVAFRMKQKGGGYRWVETTSRVVQRAGDAPDVIIATTRDIEDRKKVEDALRYRLEFEDILTHVSTELIGLPVSLIDLNVERALTAIGEFMAVDRSYVFVFRDGHTKMENTHEWCQVGIESYVDQLKDLNVDDFYTARQMVGKRAVFKFSNLSELPASATADREEFAREGIRSMLSIPMIGGGDVIGFLGMDSVKKERLWSEQDIALLRAMVEAITNALLRKKSEERKKHLEEQVRQSQKLESLGVLAGGIAHDFNNLLMSIIGNTELALYDIPEQSPLRLSMNEIQEAALQASELSKQMLAYSGKGRFVSMPVNLGEVTSDMLALLKTTVSKKVGLEVKLGSDIPLIQADRGQLQQVLLNLVTNASEAIAEEEEGTVSIEVDSRYCNDEQLDESRLPEKQPEGLYVCLKVTDTGIGMSRGTAQKIFEPFFSTKFSGRGLGLASVLGIIRGHAGAIMVDSEKGKGTVFQVLFPVSEENSDSLPPKPDSQGLVLLVEDETAVRDVARRMLEKLGYEVVEAVDGREAVEKFTEYRLGIYCTILDLNLPGLSGEEVLREIRTRSATSPVILSSGYGREQLETLFLGQDVSAYLQKPYRLEQLKEILRDLS